MKVGPGSLKCVVVPGRADEAASILRDRVRPEDVRPLDGTALLVYTDATTAELRDWLKDSLADGASLLITEFEVWSSHGDAVDRDWLRDRGH